MFIRTKNIFNPKRKKEGLNMFLVSTKSWVFKFSPYEIFMVILVLPNILVCKNSPYFENFLQKMYTFSPPK